MDGVTKVLEFLAVVSKFKLTTYDFLAARNCANRVENTESLHFTDLILAQ